MKIILRQNKPEPWQNIIAILSLLLLLADIVMLCCWDIVIKQSWGGDALGTGLYVIIILFVIVLIALPVITVELDTDNKYYYKRCSFRFFSFIFSEKRLPYPDYISVFRQTYSYPEYNRYGERKIADYSYKLTLWNGNKSHILSTHYTVYDAFENAKKVANAFNCRLYNAANPESTIWETFPTAE